jgi:short-subunit dehydrogenase
MSSRILIIGATSAIATAVARRYAGDAARIFLVGRQEAALHALADDLRVRGAADVDVAILDALDTAAHGPVIERAFARWGGFDRVLLAHGVLPDQLACEQSVDAALVAFDINARSVLALALLLASRMQAQGSGAIALISSPAGERGRQSNYIYGAAKASVTVLAAGLRHRLASCGVRVLTILPGFVDTPMTAGFAKGPLWASPDKVAGDIVGALERGFGTIYTPWFWRWIMAIICAVPERIFVRTRL